MFSKGKTLVLLFLLAIMLPAVYAQEPVKDKIVLKTGEVYSGKIIVNNSEVIIIQLDNGSRFQIRPDEVKSTEKITESKEVAITHLSNSATSGNICGMLDVSGGISSAASAIETSPFFDISLSFGVKSFRNKSLFAGLGAGYFNVFYKDASLGFIPFFARFGSNDLSSRRTSPCFLFDVGYAVATDNQPIYKGGMFARLSVGIIRKINYKTAFFLGPFASVQSVNGSITEVVNSNTIRYNGFAALYSFGLKAGVQF